LKNDHFKKKKNLVNNIPSFYFILFYFGLVEETNSPRCKNIGTKKENTAPQSRLPRRLEYARECLAAATQSSGTVYQNLLHPVCTV
jgi:hypothetical protein